MKIIKHHCADLFKCYSTTGMLIQGKWHYLFATEDKGPCLDFSGDDFTLNGVVWEGPGGTMSIIPIPNKPNQFLAVQEFFPTFNAPDAKIVWGEYTKQGWVIHPFIDLPYVHRFDLIQRDGIVYFVAGTLATSKQDRDDWSDPGKIMVGILPESWTIPMELKSVKDQLTRHHGYSRGTWDKQPAGFFTADEGVFALIPPGISNPDWRVDQLMNQRVSDIAVFDIDNDGIDELITIEPFHGNAFVIRKQGNEGFEEVYRYPSELDFAHVVWGGNLNGIRSILGGARRLNKEFFCIRYDAKQGYTTTVLESGFGPSNIHVIQREGNDHVLLCNREHGEAAVLVIEG